MLCLMSFVVHKGLRQAVLVSADKRTAVSVAGITHTDAAYVHD